ncbi:ribonuclease H-like domain-containing protein [Tanacetum coccineum]
MKGINREFSVARTPQQNGVAERMNRTLIEAARTMLVDSKLPTTFWAEVVNTACYVLNRVLVIKPHNKTSYELIRRTTPLIDFMKPFRCPVTILNTRDHIGKFDRKADEGFFVGYSMEMDQTSFLMLILCQAEKKIEPEQEYILIPICTTDPLISQDPKVSGNEYSLKDKNGAKTDKTEHGNRKSIKSLSQRRVHLKWTNPHPFNGPGQSIKPYL